jgi:thymidylate synthase (FAD)
VKISEIQVTPIHPERWGDDLDVVNAARVSFHKESTWWEDSEAGPREGILKVGDEKLINYLAKHKHFSPFNHSFLSFRIKAPIFVARQLVKHKFMPWNEVSRRYVDEEPEFYMPELRMRADDKKQGSSDKVWSVDWKPRSMREALKDYEYLIEEGVAPEVARAFLPQNMMTEWIWSGTLGAFLDMLVLRLDPHTQRESQIVAKKIYEYVREYFPVSTKSRIELT